MTENSDALTLADNLEGYARDCVHIGSPESVRDLISAAAIIRAMAGGYMIGKYRVDYANLTADEIQTPAPEVEELFRNSKPKT